MSGRRVVIRTPDRPNSGPSHAERLDFLVDGAPPMLCTPEDAANDAPATARSARPNVRMQPFAWPDDPSVEFHIGYRD